LQRKSGNNDGRTIEPGTAPALRNKIGGNIQGTIIRQIAIEDWADIAI
jgi:hypothetical protein